MSKQDVMKVQSYVLKVDIHCDGCRKKVKKLLQKIEGVYTVAIDAEKGKVTVTGIADPKTLIKKLEKSGKHAELWGPPKGSSNKNNLGSDGNQFKNIQFDNGKFGKLDNKAQGNGGGNKSGHQQIQQQQLQQLQQQQLQRQQLQQLQLQQQQQQLMKGLKDMKMAPPAKDQKTVKFNLPEHDEFDGSEDDFSDDFGDDDSYDDDFEDDFGHEHGHGNNQKPAKQSTDGGGHGQKGNKGKGNGEKGNEKKGSGGGAKKGSFFDSIPFLKKNLGTKSDGKPGNGGKKNDNGGGGGGKSKKKGDADEFDEMFGKIGKNGNFGEVMGKNKGGNGNGNGNGGGNNHGNGAKKGGGGKNHDGPNKAQVSFNGMENHHAAGPVAGKIGGGGAMGGYPMGAMGGYPMAQMGGYPMSQMGGMPAVQGLPAMNGGGYYQNPYQQQQYMGMMMNQHQQHHGHGNEMYQPMMYARGPYPMGYVPPMPPPSSDPMVHFFNDENTGSCTVM